jgi:hypothetical protein
MGHTNSPFRFLFFFDLKPQEAQPAGVLDGFSPLNLQGGWIEKTIHV